MDIIDIGFDGVELDLSWPVYVIRSNVMIYENSSGDNISIRKEQMNRKLTGRHGETNR